MKSQSIVSPEKFIDEELSAKGLKCADFLFKKPVVLLFSSLHRKIKTMGLSSYVHPYWSNGFETESVIFLPARASGPFMAIQVEELCCFKPSALIYIGIAGAISPDLKIGDIVLSTGALNESGVGKIYGFEFDQVITSSNEQNQKIRNEFLQKNIQVKEGLHWCTDGAYEETWEKVEKYRNRGGLVVEMEASGLFAVSHKRKVPASSLFIVSDEILENEWIQGWNDERRKSAEDRVLNILTQSDLRFLPVSL